MLIEIIQLLRWYLSFVNERDAEEILKSDGKMRKKHATAVSSALASS
jgi:hypothetical protein